MGYEPAAAEACGAEQSDVSPQVPEAQEDKHYLLTHVDMMVGVQAHHGVLGCHHHGGWHRDLGQGLPGCRVLGQVDHTLLLALGAVRALLLPGSSEVGDCPPAMALA